MESLYRQISSFGESSLARRGCTLGMNSREIPTGPDGTQEVPKNIDREEVLRRTAALFNVPAHVSIREP